MKKGFFIVLASGVFSAAVFNSCGEKFTALTEEQKTAKVDSLFNAQKEAKLTELRAACQSDLSAKVEAKVQELQSAGAETASK